MFTYILIFPKLLIFTMSDSNQTSKFFYPSNFQALLRVPSHILRSDVLPILFNDYS